MCNRRHKKRITAVYKNFLFKLARHVTGLERHIYARTSTLYILENETDELVLVCEEDFVI